MHSNEAVIRNAQQADCAALIELAAQKRLEYQQYQPRFWRIAAEAREKQLAFFTSMINRDDVLTFVCERADIIEGFTIADFVSAPPVYDPQGLVCRVDDFCIAQGQTWEDCGLPLLKAVMQEARRRGAVLSVVVCGHQDEPKRAMLKTAGFGIASEWYVKEL